MLSSLSLASFLPSILQPNTNNQDQPCSSDTPPPPSTTTTLRDDKNDTDTARQAIVDVPNPRKKSKKDRPPHETFIVVRPPPSKSIHPLSLQVQLVPPQSRVAGSSSTMHALDSSHPDGTTDSSEVARTSSDRSDYSGYTSATSISSFASTSTTSSGRRTIIPLYNLQAHHVMTNTIVDAGTDAKVAKFVKRGLEIVGLAVLEPIEVWGSAPLPQTIPPQHTARTSIDEPQREFGALSPRLNPRTHSTSKGPDRPLTSHSTVSALDRDPDQQRVPGTNVTLFHTDSVLLTSISAGGVPQPQRKKFFTSMFKKKDSSRTLSTAVPTSGTDIPALPSAPPRVTSQNVPRGGSLLYEPPHSSIPESAYAQPGFGNGCLPPTPVASTTSTTSTVYCPPILGVQATLYPGIQLSSGRPTKYVWVIRKWLKGSETGLLNGMKGKLSINGRTGGGGTGNANASVAVDGSSSVEVRFEWERGKKKQREKDRGRGKRQVGENHNETGQNNRKQTTAVGRQPNTTLSIPSPAGSIRRTALDAPAVSESQRHSLVSQQSGSDTVTDESSIAPHNAQPHQHRHSPGDDSGDDSDPEDSETPWICTLTIRRLWSHSPSSSFRHPGVVENHHSQPRSVCLKVATLSPTPHHPKVVGLLKVPFPLPDIEVEHMAVRKRIVTAHGVSRTTAETPSSGAGGLVLTAEEIKDTISSTALWLVVREGFGGIGRDKKRGEGGGWKIRA
ncbi:hypothetical protein EDC04DRAFT_2570547 [Pisolithus marmoratus]|nr:hypothetical protein EDC04DRAFT_2570547 [Pisolithus marmoratus]